MLLAVLGLQGLTTTALVAALPQDISILPEVPCPFAAGDVVIVDDDSFSVRRGQAYTSPSLGAYTVQRTFDACLARCGDTPRCVAVNYNAVDRKCELKSSLGSTVTSPLTFTGELLRNTIPAEKDVNELAERQTEACPFTFEDVLIVEDQFYSVQCDTAYNSDSIGGSTTQPTFDACLARCGNTPRCAAVNYNTVDLKCTLKTAATDPVASPLTWAAQRALNPLITDPIPPPAKRDVTALANSHEACPYNATETYDANSFSYRVQCGRQIPVDAEGVNTAGDIFKDIESCLEFCESVAGCDHVSFTPDDGWCFFFASAAETSEDELSWVGELIRDPAPAEEVVNELAERQKLEPVIPCPFAADDVVSVVGFSWRRYCERQFYGVHLDELYEINAKSFDECLEFCTFFETGCMGITWDWTVSPSCSMWQSVEGHAPRSAKWSAYRIDESNSSDDPVLSRRQVVPEGTQSANVRICVGSRSGVEDWDIYCDHHWEGGKFTREVAVFGVFSCMAYCNNFLECVAFASFDGGKCQLHNKDAVLVKGAVVGEDGKSHGLPVAMKRKDGVPHPRAEPTLVERQEDVSPACPWNVDEPVDMWTVGGFTYVLTCDTVYKDGLGHKDDVSFEQCLALCSARSDCHAVSYEFPNVPARCSLWASTQEPVSAIATWTAVRVGILSEPAPVVPAPGQPPKRQVAPEDVHPDSAPWEVCTWANINFVDYPNIEVRAEHWDVYCNAHWEGGVLIDDFGIAEFSGCVVLCQMTPDCVAFTWLGPGDSNCVIHDKDAVLVKGARGDGVAARRKDGVPRPLLPFALQ